MKISEIERDLRGNAHPRLVYWIQFLMEQSIAQQQQLDQNTDLLVNIVKVQENLQGLLEGGFTKELEAQQRNRSTDMVESVLTKDEDD